MIGGNAPGAVLGAAAGTSPTGLTLTRATDRKGTVTFTSGTSPATGTLLTFTYDIPHLFTGAVPVIQEGNTATKTLGLIVSSDSSTGFVVTATVAPVAGTAYKLYYHVIN